MAFKLNGTTFESRAFTLSLDLKWKYHKFELLFLQTSKKYLILTPKVAKMGRPKNGGIFKRAFWRFPVRERAEIAAPIVSAMDALSCNPFRSWSSSCFPG